MDFIPLGKSVKLFIGGPVNAIIHNQVKDFIVKLLRKRGKQFKFLPCGIRKFTANEAEIHFAKHGNNIMESLGKKSYNISEYLEDANQIIKNGIWVPELNGYVKLIGGLGKAKYGFVGLDRMTGDIRTFHIKTVEKLAKKAPSLGLKY